MATSIHSGHRERMRKRFEIGGLASFEQHEIVEMLLFYGVPRRDTNPLAHELVNTFGSLMGVLDAPKEELMRIDGVSENVAIMLNFAGAVSREYFRRQAQSGRILNNTAEMGKFALAQLLGAQREQVLLISLDHQCRVLNSSKIAEGSVNATEINFRLLLQTALRFNASAVILAHNHPNGFALPSRQDVQSTIAVNQAFAQAGICLVDHLIIADNDFVSMKETSALSHIFSLPSAPAPEAW